MDKKKNKKKRAEFDLRKHTILLTVAGSRAYGMHTDDSDVDLKGVCIPPRKCRDGFLHRFEQSDNKKDMMLFSDLLSSVEKQKGEEGEVEGTIYDIRKFFALAAQNNPNIMDALFCRPEEVRFSGIPGAILRTHAESFLSRKSRWTFGGYARSQLKRIETHRRWLLEPPFGKPLRSDYNLPERTLIPANQLAAAQDAIKKKIDSWEVDYGSLDESEKIYIQDQLAESWAEMKVGSDEKFAAAARMIGYDENFIELLDRERRYRGALTNFNQYLTWKDERNAERAALEAKFGYDTKHGSHLVRLLRMCREILTDGVVNVYRPDADELLSIRRGEWTYEDILAFVEDEETKINEAYKTSQLPDVPDKEELDKLCCRLVKYTVFVEPTYE